MLKLKNIVIENNIISCNITPEDSKSSGTMQYDVENDKVLMFSFHNFLEIQINQNYLMKKF